VRNRSIITETDTVFLSAGIVFPADNRAERRLVVQESAQTHSQHAGNFDKRRQRRKIDVFLDAPDLFYAQAATLGHIFAAKPFVFSDVPDFCADYLIASH
jgi:hypothetical protein